MLKHAGARLLDDRDVRGVRAVLATDPVMSCMVAARIENSGLDPWRLGGELWGFAGSPEDGRGGRLEGLCFSGANLVPLCGGRSAIRAFAERAALRARSCSSMVGPADLVLGLWSELCESWGPARDERPSQPLMVLAERPLVPGDPLVRPVSPDELDRYLPAAVAMFTEEVGVDPLLPDGGAGYRARVAELIAAGRAFARFEAGEVVFKAEIGAMSATVGQIQGVWVHPGWRGQGLAAAATAAVVARLQRMGRVASLYVNAYNLPALATYRRVGFTQVGCFATVLF
ncbi:MAG: GNAT family N-acetyltransferase [Pseudonocardiales bacterium]|nr:GNAT family N-acetyltransferase [Pseudonocardiales bacterium]MBV9029469.1 GNAT family N-acetyltransferase [Pseudonocardiales bacterium]MBW0010084.1 GNAT family N-acetyltransferase [Pseudonocardiales bacterium]